MFLGINASWERCEIPTKYMQLIVQTQGRKKPQCYRHEDVSKSGNCDLCCTRCLSDYIICQNYACFHLPVSENTWSVLREADSAAFQSASTEGR